MRTVVVNLTHRPDRLTGFLSSYRQSEWSCVLGDPEVVQAVDGKRAFRTGGWRDYGAGVFGCYLSHVTLISDAIDDEVDQLFVFEDDAVFRPKSSMGLKQFLADVPSHDALWLGGQHFHAEPANGIRKVRKVLRTHAYSLSRATMLNIFPALVAGVGPMDTLFASSLAQTDVWCPDPMMVGQANIRSDITGRVEPERWWNGNPE